MIRTPQPQPLTAYDVMETGRMMMGERVEPEVITAFFVRMEPHLDPATVEGLVSKRTWERLTEVTSRASSTRSDS